MPPTEFVRGYGLLIVAAGLSGGLCTTIAIRSRARQRRRWRAVWESPHDLVGEIHPRKNGRAIAAAIGMLILLAVCCEIVLWASRDAESSIIRALLSAVTATAGSGAMFYLVGRRWSVGLAEAAMGLMTLAVASAGLVFVPTSGHDADARHAMTFNILMIALATMTWFWVWLGRVWEQQLDGGEAWTAAGHLSKTTPGFAFLLGSLSLLIGFLTAIWPRLRAVGVFDDSLGRVTTGVAGHLWLMIVLMWCGRKTGRTSFGLLSALSGVSLVVFIAVRAKPLWSTLHFSEAAALAPPWLAVISGARS